MKMKIFFLAVTLLPLFVFAGNDDKEKEKKEIDIHIKFDKKGTRVTELQVQKQLFQDSLECGSAIPRKKFTGFSGYHCPDAGRHENIRTQKFATGKYPFPSLQFLPDLYSTPLAVLHR